MIYWNNSLKYLILATTVFVLKLSITKTGTMDKGFIDNYNKYLKSSC